MNKGKSTVIRCKGLKSIERKQIRVTYMLFASPNSHDIHFGLSLLQDLILYLLGMCPFPERSYNIFFRLTLSNLTKPWLIYILLGWSFTKLKYQRYKFLSCEFRIVYLILFELVYTSNFGSTYRLMFGVSKGSVYFGL